MKRQFSGAVSLAIGLGFVAAPAIAVTTPITAHAAAAWYAGAAAEKITPLPYNAANDAVEFPTCDTTTVYTGRRLFDFEEPYIDQAGSGFFQYPDPYCDANNNGRWDGLYNSGGVATLLTWVHDDIWARALAISDGTHTVIIESLTSQGLMIEDTQRIRSGLTGYAGVTGNEPPVAEVFASSDHNESSPDPIGIYGAPADPSGTVGVHSGIDDYYITFLVQQAVKAGKEAVDALAAAQVRVGEFSPPDVQARLSTTFLTTDSNPAVSSGPTADGTPEATDTKAIVLQLRNAQTGANIETLFNWAAHNQQTGHAPPDSMAPDPNDGNTLKPIDQAVSDDWPGVFASTVEAQLGGHAMFLVGDNGTIEDPHEYPLPDPDTECPPTDFNPPRSQGTAEGCVTLPRLTGTRLGNDVLNIVGSSSTPAPMEDVASHAIAWATRQFNVPLQNQLFIAAFGGGIFAHRTASTVSPCVDAENTPRTCFLTEVGLLDLGPQLEMLTAPGEAYPSLIEGHPFGMEQISCPERAEPPTADWHATATHKLQMGLGDDMLGYMIPAPGWFADSAVYSDPSCPQGSQAQSNPAADYDQYNNYHKLESESVGPDTGNAVAVQLTELADCAAAGALQSCAGAPALCQTSSHTIESGRFLLANGSFTRKGGDGSVGMWLLPCGTTTFTPGTGTLIAVSGISAFGSVAVNATGVFMDFDGRPQTAPDINTRGMLVTSSGGGTAYYFMDPYAPLTGSSPGAAVQTPVTSSVTTTVIDEATGLAWTNAEQTGSSAHDTAGIGGQRSGQAATGTVTYSLFGNGSCTGSAKSTQTVTLDATGGVPDAGSTGPLAPGSYAYQAGYSGDANYTSSTSPCEPFTVHGWRLQPITNPSGAKAGSLSGVACPSATLCIAVGNYTNSSGVSVTLAERWNGSSWAVQTTPNPTGAKSSLLRGVACPSITLCTAVGYYTNSAGVGLTLAERWNGSTWAMQSTPNPAGAKASLLSGVACASNTVCTAVGYASDISYSSGTGFTLAERWSGGSWAIQSTPNPATSQSSVLRSVACPSTASCTAVGSYTNSSAMNVTLAERWNGSGWAIQPTANPTEAKGSVLRGIACQTTTHCSAVGNFVNASGVTLTLAERWNGTAWAVQSTPSPIGARASVLNGVACPSNTLCAAVGSSTNSSGVQATLAAALNGGTWAIQSTPNPIGTRAGVLSGVACPSTALCTAVGNYVNSSGGEIALAEQYF